MVSAGLGCRGHRVPVEVLADHPWLAPTSRGHDRRYGSLSSIAGTPLEPRPAALSDDPVSAEGILHRGSGSGNFLLPGQQEVFGQSLQLLNIRDGTDVACSFLQLKLLTEGEGNGLHQNSGD